MSETKPFHVAENMISCRRKNFMSAIKFHVADGISCRRENDFMSPQKISCRRKLTHVGAKSDFMSGNEFHVGKMNFMSGIWISCRQKFISCRRKVDFMSPKKFHVAEKVDFPDVNRRTLKIASRTLSDVVNRESLCSTIAFYFSCFRKVGGCQAPWGSTYTIYLCLGCLNKAMLHTDTHKHTYTDTESALRTPVRESQPQEKPEPSYPKMGAEVRPQFWLMLLLLLRKKMV